MKLKKPTWAPKSYEVEESNLKHLNAAFGSLLLIDISADDIAGRLTRERPNDARLAPPTHKAWAQDWAQQPEPSGSRRCKLLS